MLLRDLLHGLVDLTDENVWLPSDNAFDQIEVASVASDDRDCVAGTLFACVKGARVDGHDRASAAVANGAVAILVEHRIPLIPSGVPQVVVPSVRAVLGAVAATLVGNPSGRLSVVGVTGTNGKTTVTYLLESIAEGCALRVGVIGTLGARWGSRTAVAGFTTPEAPVLQQLLGEMAGDGVDVVAVEVSSHSLDYFRVDGTKFANVAFTNLSNEHLDLHGDIENYFAAKLRLFTRGFSRSAVVCVDDEFGVRLARAAHENGLAVRTVSVDQTRSDADVVARDIVFGSAGTRFVASSSGFDLPIVTNLVGSFNVANSLVAIELARSLGIADASIAKGLANASQVPGRMELVPNELGVTVVVDYAHTPHALETVLATLRALVDGDSKLIAVYGCGGDRDRTKRPLMGRVVAQLADTAVLTSDNPRSEAPEAIIADVIDGLGPSDREPIVILDRHAAIRLALEAATAGDIVLIAGKGHESGQTANGVTVEFDDRLVAAHCLSEMAQTR